ncbi:mucoidy inhibitor MuiA family protein, partial [bacterium]|nr:mucoidy inhibitor MuiA family protein [bacterium]
MNRYRSHGFALLVLAASIARAAAVQGNIETVTLYRGQALVTRRVPVEAKRGGAELVVGGLPEHILPDSLFAEAGAGIEIRAVRFRTRAVGEEPREEVRKLEEQIQMILDKKAQAQKLLELVQQRLQYLAKLEGFSAPTAKAEITKGVLDFKALKEITLFTFEERQKAADESLKLQGELRTLGREEALLQRRRSKLTSGSSRTVREAVLFVENPAGAKTDVRLSYLVGQAGWSPVYNFRAGQDRTKVGVEYNALIQQMSGEDWSGVKLTLSTASPGLSAQGPGLAPWRVDLTQGKAPGQLSPEQSAQRYARSQKQLQQAEKGQRGSQAQRSNLDFNWKMNTAAFDAQNLELVLEKDALQSIASEPAEGDGTSVTYELGAPVSLASRSDQQMLRIADMQLPSRFAHVATP